MLVLNLVSRLLVSMLGVASTCDTHQPPHRTAESKPGTIKLHGAPFPFKNSLPHLQAGSFLPSLAAAVHTSACLQSLY